MENIILGVAMMASIPVFFFGFAILGVVLINQFRSAVTASLTARAL